VVVLVSARGPNGVRAVAADAGIVDGIAICSNGALVLDLARGESTRHRPLPSEIASEVVRGLRRRLPDVCFATETESRFALERAFEGAWDAWQLPPGTRFGDALELVTVPVTKLIARDVTCSTDELAAIAAEIVGESAVVSHAGRWVVEINMAGVSKGAALEELAAELGIAAREAVAFGDYPNDLPMLAWAGRSFAPANAHESVLAEVDEVTESNDDDGVARAIERLLAS
jgi:Cof subfamily protein (haloacid dehalogenase superfamily)